MCPKCTRRNSMLPSSFKREKRWQNADMEMNSFSIARIPIPRRQEYKKKRFSSPGHQYKMQIGNQTFFPLPEYQYNAYMNTNKNVFPFPGYHYKNVDLKSIHFFFHCQNTKKFAGQKSICASNAITLIQRRQQ